MIRMNTNPSSSRPSDPIQQGVSTPSLAAGASTNVTATFTLSSAGTYYAHVYVDNLSQLPQSSTGNDSAHVGTVTVSTAGQSDLTPQSVTFNSASITAGGSVTVTVTVKNVGTATAAATQTM